MVETLVETINCPLCGGAVEIDRSRGDLRKVSEGVLANRGKWRGLSDEFRSRRSLQTAARALSLSDEQAREILLFISTELCGCRRVTCTSCVDDHRSEL